jgi:alkylation response protein AidB-like acyl-CoA dehydrogenase
MELSIIRHKLGQMVRLVESQHAWIESLVYQLNQLSDADGTALLGGQSALLKAHCGITLEFVAREAVQILGGLGYTRGGAGERYVSFCHSLFLNKSSLCCSLIILDISWSNILVSFIFLPESNVLGERSKVSQSPVGVKK